MSLDTEDASSDGKTVGIAQVHTNTGDRGGVIVELRPEGFDIPAERDMSHLSDEKARELRNQLNDYLGEPIDFTKCVSCGSILDDPTNSGHPTDRGNWVCDDPVCEHMEEVSSEAEQEEA